MRTTAKCSDCYNNVNVAYGTQGISRSWALTPYVADHYEVPGTGIVKQAKTNQALTRAMMAVAAAMFAEQGPWPTWKPDIIVPCPSNRDPKPFVRSLALGQGVQDTLGLPLNDILIRTDAGGSRHSQKSKPMPNTFAELLATVKIQATGTFSKPVQVLLVDDLRTQGVTAGSSAYALRGAGASDVRLLTFAKYESTDQLERYCD